MLFSIIIPTYNRSLILKDTLTSVLNQSFTDYEIIVVDDGSTDNTDEVIKEFKNEKIRYYYKKNEERSVARNFGADKASGEYLIFLDSDDRMKENHLSSVNEFIQLNKNAKFLFAGYVILNPDKTVLYEYGVDGVFRPSNLFYGNFLGCSSIIVSSTLFKNYYFNTDRRLILFEDWELWLRIISDNTLYCLPNKSIIMINHVGRSVLNYNVEEINSRILHFKNHILTHSDIIRNSFFHQRKFLMGIYSYASLHIAMTKKHRITAIKYLVLSLFSNPLFIFKRRFLGIIKQLF